MGHLKGKSVFAGGVTGAVLSSHARRRGYLAWDFVAPPVLISHIWVLSTHGTLPPFSFRSILFTSSRLHVGFPAPGPHRPVACIGFHGTQCLDQGLPCRLPPRLGVGVSATTPLKAPPNRANWAPNWAPGSMGKLVLEFFCDLFPW